MENKIVSIIIPVGNVKINILKKAFYSIEFQTYHFIEIIIVCDTDKKSVINFLKNYKKNSKKKVVLHMNNKNMGITKSLNKCIQLSNGYYIARFDADDISNLNRIKKQVQFFEKNENTDILFTYFNVFYFYQLFHIKKKITNNKNIIKWRLLFDNIFCHPTVMYKKNIFSNNHNFYDERFSVSQDYKLWTDSLVSNKNIKILPESLYYLRLHRNSVSQAKKSKQNSNSIKIGLEYLSRILNYDNKKIYSYLIIIINNHKIDKSKKLSIERNMKKIINLYFYICDEIKIDLTNNIYKKYFLSDINKMILFVGIKRSIDLSIIKYLNFKLIFKLCVKQYLKRLL